MTLRQLFAGSITLRQWAKYHRYNLGGSFRYFGYRVYFPRSSSAFHAVCAQGIFEAFNAGILKHLCRPGAYMFDVGANLGLMALPVLSSVSESKVVSFEPSPNTVPFLRRTVANTGLKDRWFLVEKAVACAPGTASFSLSAQAESLYDGLQHTHRATQVRQIQVEVTNLNKEWRVLGRPPVSMIKIDVEGGELNVLRGAQEVLASTRPFVLTEWCPLNLGAYGIACDALFHFARENGYVLYALPEMIPVPAARDLNLQALRTESFLMAPTEFERDLA